MMRFSAISSRSLATLATVFTAASATPALAQQDRTCVADYETFEVRHLSASDPASLPQEQALRAHDWAFDEEVSLEGRTYRKSGLPQVTLAGKLEFFAFKETVPFMSDPGAGPDPDVIYALYNGLDCEVQPYYRRVF